ncbi:hypothetical protein ES703_63142 [subsurface metagenome]
MAQVIKISQKFSPIQTVTVGLRISLSQPALSGRVADFNRRKEISSILENLLKFISFQKI